MPALADSALLYYVLLTAAGVALLAVRWLRRAAATPPGPRGIPFVSGALHLAQRYPWLTFTEWKHKYGDLVSLNALGTNVLILNSQAAIHELLEKRGNNYSGRPAFTVLGELMGLNQSIALMQYDAEWRACRRLEHLALSPAAVRDYQPMQERVAAQFVQELAADPDNFYDIVRLCAARIVLSVTYGLSAQIVDTEYVAHAEETMKIVSQAMVPGAFLADLFPILKHLPAWVPFQKRAAHGRRMIESMVATPFARVQQQLAEGNAGPSLARELLTSMGKEELTHEVEDRIKWTTGSMYAAGGESTFGTVLVFLIAMAQHPAAQSRAQQEVDALLAPDARLPRVDDRGALPYVRALVQEVMRWRPMLPLGIARQTLADDVYEGYFIPKGTVVMPNSWQIAHAPDAAYPPDQFLPERFLDARSAAGDPGVWAFGYGRRLCPGKALGDASVFILVATLLATMDVLPPAPPAVLAPEFESQLVSYPKRFKVRLVPRGEERMRLVEEAAGAPL